MVLLICASRAIHRRLNKNADIKQRVRRIWPKTTTDIYEVYVI